MLTAKEIEKILSKANMPKLENILTPELIMEKNVIYRYYCSGNGLSYIGQCGDRPVIKRWQEHIGALRNNRHGITPTNKKTDYFQHAWNKYGEDSFQISVIEVIPNCTKELLNEREKDWISYYNSVVPNGFNQTEGGETSPMNNPEVKERNRLAVKLYYKNHPEAVERIKGENNPMKRPEVVAKFIGENNPMNHPGVRDKHRARVKEACNRPEYKAQQSARSKKQWSDPKIRAKMIKNNPMKRPEVAEKCAKKHIKKVYQYSMNGELVITYESQKSVKSYGYSPESVSGACNNKYNNGTCIYNGYIWSYTQLTKEQVLEIVYEYEKNLKRPHKYTFNGELVKIYENVKSVEKDGYSPSTISAICNRCGDCRINIYDRHVWSMRRLTVEQVLDVVEEYREMKEADKVKMSESLKKKVYQYTLDLKLVRTYTSRKECKEYGFNETSVSDACRNKYYKTGNIYKGFIWSYIPLTANEEEAEKIS